MSLILNALQKSAEEEGGGAGPGLATRHSPLLPEKGSKLFRLGVLAAAFGAVLVLAGLWLLRSSSVAPLPEPDPQIPQPQAGELAVAPAPPQAAQMPQPEREPASGSTQPAATQAPLPQELPTTAPPGAEQTPQPQQPAETVAPAPQLALELSPQRQQIASLYQQSLASADSEQEPASPRAPAEPDSSGLPAAQGLDVEAITRAARQRLAVEPVAAHPTPLLVDLPTVVKDEIPTIFFRQHDWSAQESTRSVNLNGKVFREGDQVAPDLQLLEIHRDFILMDFQGNEFRLRALNSWVNF
ncbi:MAG: general secretion pathway protein GspB [Halieaceae bacterium]|nr:general secretion pathway protein GspB [Halieaceae bacterium]